MKKIIILSALLHFLFLGGCTTKSDSQKFNWVTDEVMILTSEQKENLASELKSLRDNIGSQMAILIVDSLNGMTIEEFSLQKANTWGLGRKDYDDGVLITVDMRSRQIRIAVGNGLEKIITDEIAARIIRDDMVEHFRAENYHEGLHQAVRHMVELITTHKYLIGQRP